MKILYRFIPAYLLLSCMLTSQMHAQDHSNHAIASGPFQPNWESLANNYKCPQWFRDAKFGIWAHWSAQCVPEQGDWYARRMYLQGEKDYNHHVATYGHPSQFGFMEIDNLWKADKWNPEYLMALYKRAGARYFVALANHHDNLDAYNSKYHPWNSVNVGPKKDIVGIWDKIARAHGMRFGVSNHSARAWTWLQTAYGHDLEGALAGVPYDAATLTKADGKGKWWEGLDPQDLYTGPAALNVPDSMKSAKAYADWHQQNTRSSNLFPLLLNQKFAENWYLRCKDLVDTYKPDLLYFDDTEMPLGQRGFDVVAHYYNANLQWNNGSLEAVVNEKKLQANHRSAVVEDYERGLVNAILPDPWQTCTCIGVWHYDREIAENNKYKSVTSVVHMLIDIVSKNGNLLLSIPMRGDGTIDDREVAFLEGMAAWMEVNGEGIYGTRPWKVFGEGPTEVKSGMFSERETKPFTAEDVRFTSKGELLYAFVLGRPIDNKVFIRNLAVNAQYVNGQKITEVSMLGYQGKLKWAQDDKGLSVVLPSTQVYDHAVALRIKGIVAQ